MELLKKFDAQNYEDTTSVFDKYTIRGIIVRDGKIAMQCSKEGEYKIPGGGMEKGETYVQALAREVKEETGLFILQEKAVELGEILEVRKDIFDDTKKFICHSLFYYCEETGEQIPIHLTKSEIAKGYYLKWSPPRGPLLYPFTGSPVLSVIILAVVPVPHRKIFTRSFPRMRIFQLPCRLSVM
jgi:8-oxo-dGTP diphosphatase